MRIAYSPDADVLTIQLREGTPIDSRDSAEGIIVHLSAKGQPLEIENPGCFQSSSEDGHRGFHGCALLSQLIGVHVLGDRKCAPVPSWLRQ